MGFGSDLKVVKPGKGPNVNDAAIKPPGGAFSPRPRRS